MMAALTQHARRFDNLNAKLSRDSQKQLHKGKRHAEQAHKASIKSITGGLGGLFGFMPSFVGRCFAGSGASLGGLDGRGGCLVTMNPNQSVICCTKGHGMAGTAINNLTLQVHQGGQSASGDVQVLALGAAIAAVVTSELVNQKSRCSGLLYGL